MRNDPAGYILLALGQDQTCFVFTDGGNCFVGFGRRGLFRGREPLRHLHVGQLRNSSTGLPWHEGRFRRMRRPRKHLGSSMSNGWSHIHRLPSRTSCIAEQLILCTFRPPELGIRASAERTAILKMLRSLYVWIFGCWVEYGHQVIKFLLKEKAGADDIYGWRLAQFTNDTYNI
jgi:hypothetical protein